MRKIDPRAKLKTLDADLQDALWSFFEEDAGRTLKDGVTWLQDEHGIATDFRRLSEWRGWYARKIEIEQAESEAAEIADALKRSGAYSAKQLEELGNVIFLNRATKLGDAKTFAAVAGVLQSRQRLEGDQAAHQDKMKVAQQKLTLESEKLKQAERRLQLLEAKLKETDDAMNSDALSDEEKVARWKQVFGR